MKNWTDSATMRAAGKAHSTATACLCGARHCTSIGNDDDRRTLLLKAAAHARKWADIIESGIDRPPARAALAAAEGGEG